MKVVSKKTLSFFFVSAILFFTVWLLLFGTGVSFWVAVGVVCCVGGPFVVKIVSRAIFASYFEAKEDYDKRRK